ncbi:MAG: hypothetical protein ACYC4H_02205 [Desulfocucumaceae bacterium]
MVSGNTRPVPPAEGFDLLPAAMYNYKKSDIDRLVYEIAFLVR